jgi:hypothetical protein
VAAVYRDHCTGDVPGLLRAQKHDHVRYILRVTEATEDAAFARAVENLG